MVFHRHEGISTLVKNLSKENSHVMWRKRRYTTISTAASQSLELACECSLCRGTQTTVFKEG